MSIINWAESKIQNFTIWDMGVFKTALVIFGIVIGAYISSFVQQYVWYFVGVFLILYAYLLYRMFG